MHHEPTHSLPLFVTASYFTITTIIIIKCLLRPLLSSPQIGLPNAAQRKAILAGYLRKHNLEVPDSVAEELLVPAIALARSADVVTTTPTTAATTNGAVVESVSGGSSTLDCVAAATAGFSGSDLLELCSQAAQRVLAEHLHDMPAM